MLIKIVTYKVSDNNGLEFTSIDLQEVNLFVGQSGSGKTKLLNTIFNVGLFAIGRLEDCLLSSWKITLEHKNYTYVWEYKGQNIVNHGNIITKEKITILDKATNNQETLIDRDSEQFLFKNKKMPKLSPTVSSIFLFKEEDLIKPLYDGWSKVIRRSFSGSELQLASAYSNIPQHIESYLDSEKKINISLYKLFEYNLNVRLYLIKKYFTKTYNEIIRIYKSIFSFVEDCEIINMQKANISTPKFSIGTSIQSSDLAPVFAIKEAGIKNLLPLHELSSGMQKVLLIITDITTLPENAIYLMDEYENSLGINAINFLPALLLEHQQNKQFLITSHHPYLINKMPVLNWYVLHRKGYKVDIKYGKTLADRYGKSKQSAFINLINDPFYNMENE